MMDRYRRQVPFVLAKTLTNVAQEAQDSVIEHAQRDFATTTKWFNKKTPTGIKVEAANKKKLESTLYTGRDNYWMRRQVTGEDRTSEKNLVTPVYSKTSGKPSKRASKWRGIKRQTWTLAEGLKALYGKYSHVDGQGRQVTKTSRSRKTNTLKLKRFPLIIRSKDGNKIYLLKKPGGKPEMIFSMAPRREGVKSRFPFHAYGKLVFMKRAKDIFYRNLHVAIITPRRR